MPANAYCGYCLGDAVFNDVQMRWEHATDEERITSLSSGDTVSALHNQAGTPIAAYDLCGDQDERLTSPAWTTDVNVD